MKQIALLIAVFGTLSCYSQRISLLDKNFKRPILFTDSISAEQIKNGYFPIETNKLDTFYANVNYIMDILKVRQRMKMQSFELRAGTSKINISRVPYANGDRYSGTVRNKFNEMEAVMPLLNHSVSNKTNAKHLQKLLDYLKRNKSLFTEPYGIHPKLYNVVIITD